MLETTVNEFTTRTDLIDQQLAQAGWSKGKRNLIEEVRLKSAGVPERDLVADYVLMGADSKPIGIVEAKRTSRDELAGKRQAADYADAIQADTGFDPFIFLTNGREIQFWDRTRYAPRKIAGFYTRDDLERLAHQRQYALPLSQVSLNGDIAGRDYQSEAIRRVTESIDAARRRFLLVMATGTGKTRTTIALVDVLLRARRVQRVLFLADRRELVRQAMGEFKAHLPNESLVRIEGGTTSGARIQFATYPSMMQAYERLSVGYYDLIIADESHRSIYRRYKALFDHFDALQLGLTATPTHYIDHNTFELFDCGEGVPTYHYSYQQAVDEGNLVNYRVLDAQTNFQIEGIQGRSLPASLRQMVLDQGVDLNEVNFEGSEIERTVINVGTNEAMVREFMDRCRKDVRGLPHKTIIFAVSHAHAKRLYECFNRLYPELQRQGLAEIIDSHMERADATLDDFKYKNFPRVAISVDMLDTGVDVPAIQNLVFAKPVFSSVKFWQMIGRGTRLWRDPASNLVKRDFLIIDHWKNFDYFQLEPDGEIAHATEPLPVRLFRLRLEKWLLLQAQQLDTSSAIIDLQGMLAALPRHSINVRPFSEKIDMYLQHWPAPSIQEQEYLTQTLAPLMQSIYFGSLEELQYRVWCEQLTVAWLESDQTEQTKVAERIQKAISSLASNVPDVKRVEEERVWVQSEGFWRHLDLTRLTALQGTFAPLMRYRTSTKSQVVELNLPDMISRRSWIIYGPTGEGAFAENYRGQVEALVRRLADELPALSKLKRGESVTDEELNTVAETLNQADLFITEETLRNAYEQPSANLADFLRHILIEDARLPNREERINAAFDAFIAEHGYLRANQLNFLRAVKAAVLRHGRINRVALSQPPFSRVGRVETLFPPQEIEEIIAFTNRLADVAA